MRLICPNCDANYEIDADVIPAAGRDVQCSNCGHTWFQAHEDEQDGLLAAVARQAGEVTEPAQHEDPADESPEPAPTPPAQDDPTQDDAGSAGSEDPVAAERPRQELDDTVLGILREEAAREARVRDAEGGGLETQTELGLDDGLPVPGTAAEGTDATAPGKTAPRRNLLPDIEEINSTLRAASDRENAGSAEAAAEAAGDSKSGFRGGFLLMIALLALGLILYVWAPEISTRLPAAEPALNTWVEIVDRMRVWLDAAMNLAIDAISGLTAGENAEQANPLN